MPDYGRPLFATVTDPSPLAATQTGWVRGENRRGIAIFRGIPYGADTRARRFQPPLPAEAWEGVRDCTHNGPIAPQYGGSISGYAPIFDGGTPEKFGFEDEVPGENCLVLNVLTPGLDNAKRPVLFYIHGGGYFNGTGTLALGADDYCREQDQVVVSVNHRLNLFGYLYLGGLDPRYASSGMAGMLDLVLALRWVRDNIAAFGGDPGQVTIMGESGGGSKVSTLLAMPEAQGLFRAAVIESGSGPVGALSREQADAMTRQVLQALSLTPENWTALLELPMERLLKATKLPGLGRFSPVADDIHLASNPEAAYTWPAWAQDKPLVIGGSEDESAAFIDKSLVCSTDATLREELLQPPRGQAFGQPQPLCSPRNVDEVLRVLRETAKPTDDANDLYIRAISAAGLAKGVYEHTMAFASQPHAAPLFHYCVRYDSVENNIPGHRFSSHTADLPLQLRIVRYKESEFLSRLMSDCLAAFVRTGNPSTPQLAWPPFTLGDMATMVFDDVCRVEPEPQKPLFDALQKR